MLLAGYREVVFGIGDIKAMVSAMISLSALLPLTPVMVQEGQLLSIVPSAIMLVINAGLSSILFFPYLAIRNAVRGGQFDFAWFLTVPDGEDPRKFSERDLSGRRLRIYKVPFIVPILIGSIATALFGGAWPVLLVR
ncbi:hypothetical protein [Thermogymnomonas acidicola]|uniref:hypothetical protein n=1 Tax=Thermogymnomonas acidicola TaxID=399579 RepID=UPI001396C0F3|nr:hypothetical protein [Thermogymnomonas acidicola]